jgi:hypothetical protein
MEDGCKTSSLYFQGCRNPGAKCPRFQKCPFSGSKVPFTSVKNVVQIAFFAQRSLIYDCICFCILVCPEKCCYVRVKLCYARNFFFIFGKKYDISGTIFDMSGKFFEMTSPPPVANISGWKFLGALFHSKSAPQSLAPTLRCSLRPCVLFNFNKFPYIQYI